MSDIKTGTTVNATEFPSWCVVDGLTGKVVTFAEDREEARGLVWPGQGERIAKVTSVSYCVSK